MTLRHPEASKFVFEHLLALEAFFDNSIVAGLSHGVAKAQIIMIKGVLLGNLVGRFGKTADPEKTQVMREFAPLTEPTRARHFLGCTN